MASQSRFDKWFDDLTGLWGTILEKIGGAYYKARPNDLKTRRTSERRSLS